MNAPSTSHYKTGAAENQQQPLIGDNNLENLSKTGSFLSHLAREFSGGRASTSSRSNSGSIIASGLTAMKATSSRNNSCGSDNSGGASGSGSGSRVTAAAGKRVMRKHQPSVSESSVCEEAREIDDPIQCKSLDPTSSPIACNPNEQLNKNEPKTVSTKHHNKIKINRNAQQSRLVVFNFFFEWLRKNEKALNIFSKSHLWFFGSRVGGLLI